MTSVEKNGFVSIITTVVGIALTMGSMSMGHTLATLMFGYFYRLMSTRQSRLEDVDIEETRLLQTRLKTGMNNGTIQVGDQNYLIIQNRIRDIANGG